MENQDKKILIVDDDKSILNILARVLQKQGYSVDTSETGQEAMEKLKTQKYDLTLVDIKLPDTNGTDLLAKMHATNPNMIKIAITGFPSLEDANKVLNRGAVAYLVKPIRSEELIRIVAEKLKNQKRAADPT
jgi:DNA-binding NtrC family response regulator